MGRLKFKHRPTLALSGIKFLNDYLPVAISFLKRYVEFEFHCYDFDFTLVTSYGAIRRNVYSHFYKNMF